MRSVVDYCENKNIIAELHHYYNASCNILSLCLRSLLMNRNSISFQFEQLGRLRGVIDVV